MPATATLNNADRFWQKFSRFTLFLTGLAGLAWSLAALPSFWGEVRVDSIATRILVGEQFKQGVLDLAAARLDTDAQSARADPDLVRAQALIALRFAEESLQTKGVLDPEVKLTVAEDKLKASLMLAPSDAFLWLMLYRVKNERDGFDAGNLRYLEQSYLAGPYEGWIALRRNRLALAIFPLLGEELQEKVVSEFASMVDSEFTDDAAGNLESVGWPQKDKLLASLSQVNMVARENFAKKLAYDRVKVSVPGVSLPERMWR